MSNFITRSLSAIAPYALPIANAYLTKKTHSYDHKDIKARIDQVASPERGRVFLDNMGFRENCSKFFLGLSVACSLGTIHSRWSSKPEFYVSSRLFNAVTGGEFSVSGNVLNTLSTVANVYTRFSQALSVHNTHFRGDFRSLR